MSLFSVLLEHIEKDNKKIPLLILLQHQKQIKDGISIIKLDEAIL